LAVVGETGPQERHLMFYHNLLIGLHIIAVIAWMAGLLYLPRLFAYHTAPTPGRRRWTRPSRSWKPR
jgi:putative membrane protein